MEPSRPHGKIRNLSAPEDISRDTRMGCGCPRVCFSILHKSWFIAGGAMNPKCDVNVCVNDEGAICMLMHIAWTGSCHKRQLGAADNGWGKTQGQSQQSKLVFCKNANKCTCTKPNEPQGVGKPRGRAEGPAGGATQAKGDWKRLGVKWGCLQGKAQSPCFPREHTFQSDGLVLVDVWKGEVTSH